MAIKERRDQWERMGLCTNCGRMKLEPQYAWCSRCRAKEREKKRRAMLEQMKVVLIPRYAEISKDHKCWYCEWKRFEGDRFFCPLVGTCVKEKEND